MNWYICIITSVDYYTMFDGIEIVKAKDVADAEEQAKKQFIKNTGNENPDYDGGFEEYRFVDTIINCGTTKPKIK